VTFELGVICIPTRYADDFVSRFQGFLIDLDTFPAASGF